MPQSIRSLELSATHRKSVPIFVTSLVERDHDLIPFDSPAADALPINGVGMVGVDLDRSRVTVRFVLERPESHDRFFPSENWGLLQLCNGAFDARGGLCVLCFHGRLKEPFQFAEIALIHGRNGGRDRAITI